MNKQKHEFALYFPNLENIRTYSIDIIEESIYHRIVRVLRLETDSLVILFDKKINFLVKIIKIEKKKVVVQVLEKKINKPLDPKITMLVSILKREHFEEAIYSCVELGANIIQPIITQKSYIKKIDDKELIRLNKIVISAAEQSKNFDFPLINLPININEINNQISDKSLKIYFDPQGDKLINLINLVRQESFEEIFLLIGPEGDLTLEEKELIKQSGFIFCSLTPTILRAQSAVSLSLGIFRSVLNR